MPEATLFMPNEHVGEHSSFQPPLPYGQFLYLYFFYSFPPSIFFLLIFFSILFPLEYPDRSPRRTLGGIFFLDHFLELASRCWLYKRIILFLTHLQDVKTRTNRIIINLEAIKKLLMILIQLSKLYGFKDTQMFRKKPIESRKELIQANFET